MMMILGNTTEHAIAATTTTANGGPGFGSTASLTWTFSSTTGLWTVDATSRGLLNATTTGPWRVTSVSAVTVTVGGGTTAAQAAFNTAIVPHIHFDDNNNLLISGFQFGALTNGDTIVATAANTMVVHSLRTGDTLYPADRCTWQTVPDGDRGYAVNNARFFSGAAAAGTVILDPRLGYIGKSGRFVEIAT